jgi:hypothetical protein
VVEQEGYGVREDLAKQSAHQVPQITRPHPLYGVASHKLRKNGVYPVAKTTQQHAPFGSGISLLGGVWGHKLYAHFRLPGATAGREAVANRHFEELVELEEELVERCVQLLDQTEAIRDLTNYH